MYNVEVMLKLKEMNLVEVEFEFSAEMLRWSKQLNSARQGQGPRAQKLIDSARQSGGSESQTIGTCAE